MMVFKRILFLNKFHSMACKKEKLQLKGNERERERMREREKEREREREKERRVCKERKRNSFSA